MQLVMQSSEKVSVVMVVESGDVIGEHLMNFSLGGVEFNGGGGGGGVG